jgi:hypothetical protein
VTEVRELRQAEVSNTYLPSQKLHVIFASFCTISTKQPVKKGKAIPVTGRGGA